MILTINVFNQVINTMNFKTQGKKIHIKWSRLNMLSVDQQSLNRP